MAFMLIENISTYFGQTENVMIIVVRKAIFWCIISLFVVLTIACKSVSPYSIDSQPVVKIDTDLLGIWKAKEDTDKKNFVLIQNNYDVYSKLYNYNSGSYNIYNKDYFISYFHMHGGGPLYEQFASFLSEVKKNKFLNVSYTNFKTDWHGYFF